jgi:hypothetical protein
MPTEFQSGTDWQQSSGPITNVDVHEADCWPVDDNAAVLTKDALADGLHPVIAIGGRTAADGRPLNVTGVVMKYEAGLTTATGIAVINIADGMIVRQYVSNILTYSGTVPATFETAPIVGQPVYVDDSQALSAGVTLSMSPLNGHGGLKNPQAGVLWYCQDEMANAEMGGARSAATFDTALSDSEVEQEYCVLLLNISRDLA